MEPRILVWDLETAGVNSFKADLANITCFGYKWVGEKETYCLRVSDYKGWFKKGVGLNDKPLVQHALVLMEEADLLVAHFGDKFDRRFFQGRCVIHGLNPPPPTKQRDTWRIARGAFALMSNRLGNLAKVLNLPELKHEKTRNEWPGWWHGSLAGGKKAVEAKAEYCKQDVRTLEQVYLRLRAYDNQQHPHLYRRERCGLCGGKIQYRGLACVGANKYPRFQCTQCGRWGRDRKKEE